MSFVTPSVFRNRNFCTKKHRSSIYLPWYSVRSIRFSQSKTSRWGQEVITIGPCFLLRLSDPNLWLQEIPSNGESILWDRNIDGRDMLEFDIFRTLLFPQVINKVLFKRTLSVKNLHTSTQGVLKLTVSHNHNLTAVRIKLQHLANSYFLRANKANHS